MNTTTQTVREIALEEPSSIRVFESFGIDYCCGGRKPLSEACAASSVDVDAVIAALEAAASGTVPPKEDWALNGMEDLVNHIVLSHHAYVRRELPRLASLAQNVANRHGATRAELVELQSVLATLDADLTQHLAKEEAILFPYIIQLDRSNTERTARPEACFGTVASPVAIMTAEHDAAGLLLAQIRRLSDNFTTPEGACPTYHAYFDGLKEFELDLHQHIHLENNILFPRAIKAELSER